MAAIIVSKRAEDIVNFTSGSFTADGGAQIINLGYDPMHFILLNETDVVRFDKMDPQLAANCLKIVAAGTMTLDTSSAIVFNGDKTVTISAATCIAGKAMKFLARR